MNTINVLEPCHAIGRTSLGWAFVAIGPGGLHALEFTDFDTRENLESWEVYAKAANASLVERLIALIDDWVEDGSEPSVPLDPIGTEFQMRVWNALRRIPRGETRSYADIARAIGSPDAVRAVGAACGANPIALFIPCHRVVRSNGALGGYRWGLDLKRALLKRENALNTTLAV